MAGDQTTHRFGGRITVWAFSRRAVGLAIAAMAAPAAARGLVAAEDERLAALLGRRPERPQPIGAYAPAIRVGELLYLSTTVARRDGQPIHRGAVGDRLSLDDGRAAARAAALALLEVAFDELGSLAKVAQVVNLTGYVASADGFFDQAAVMDAASKVVVEVLGPVRGRHTRSAIGVRALSREAAVAISGIIRVG